MLDRALSASAGVVALCALGVSFYQAWLTREQATLAREQQRASVWPRIQLARNSAATTYAQLVTNVGLGPALVKRVALTVDGRPVTSWQGVARALLDSATLARMQADTGLSLTTNSVVRGTVILPGTTLEHLRVRSRWLPRTLLAATERHQLVTAVCYCSLYDDCWTVTSRAREPTPARSCPAADSTVEFEP